MRHLSLKALVVLSPVVTWALIPTCVALAQIATAQSPETADPSLVEGFERDVRPLLLENCAGCHSKTVGKVMGGLSMDNRQELVAGGESGPAIDLESPDGSLLLEAVRRQSFEMPPEKPLDQHQIAILEKWLAAGAVWPSMTASNIHGEGWVAERAQTHWAWKPISQPDLAKTVQPSDNQYLNWPAGAIDLLVLEQLLKRGLSPTSPALPEDLLRRLSFDLTGLPPTVEHQLQFQQDLLVTPQTAMERVVESLLASPQFGVQWGRHWLDLMRYAETLGHEFDYPIRFAWHYRDAVLDALNDDLDYRQMIMDHLAGDMVESPRINPVTGVNQSLAMTGWWWLGDSVHAPVDIKSDLATRLENQIDVVSKSFLGMTIACARCHDHKFDAIGVEDYYGLAGILSSSRRRYAITDPHGDVAGHLDIVRKKSDESTPSVLSAWSSVTVQAVEKWLEAVEDTWQSMSAEELQQQLPTSSPLFPLRLLVGPPETADDASNHTQPGRSKPETTFQTRLVEMRQELSQKLDRYREWSHESPVLADFSQGMPKGWSLEAVGNRDDESQQSTIDWFSTNLPIPARREIFSSARFGRHQYLTLRSPNFEVSKPIVCLKLRGKSTQSCIVVSNYFMSEFHGLLFGDLRKPVDQQDESGWVTHAGDLKKYLGHSAFISLENEAGAWFELSEVRLSDRLPPVQPNDWSIEILDKSLASTKEFKAKVTERLHDALQECLHTPSRQAVSIVRAMLAIEPNPLLGTELADRLHSLALSIQQLDQASPKPTLLLAIEEGTASDTAIHLRGDPHQLGNKVPRGCLQWLPTWRNAPEGSSGRRELAISMTDSQHPLVARVMVNRVWQHLMGEGLVASPDNFGVLGSRPTHPELLDWLADQFIQHDWSIKWLIRQIVTSQTYALSSTATASLRDQDPNGRLLSHRTVRRLTAENLRDAMLLTCGVLDQRLSGPSVPIHLTEQMTGRGRPQVSGPLDGEHRRSLFIEVRRNFLNPLLLAFDFPMPSTTSGRRNRSNLPSQALSMLNDPLVAELTRHWTESTAHISDIEERTGQMIQTAFSRPATHEELQSCIKLVEESNSDGWQDLAHTLLNSKAFYYIK